MEVMLRAADGKIAARCNFLSAPNAKITTVWRGRLATDSLPQQYDSVEFLESAFSKWRLYDARGRAASSPRDFIEAIKRESAIDELGMFSVEAPALNLGESLGVCEFRRTWQHSIAIDYVAVHPALLTPKKIVSGVGSALLYAVAILAKEIHAERIWLETTDLSAGYYSRLFGTEHTDLVVIPTQKFYNVLRQYFGSAK